MGTLPHGAITFFFEEADEHFTTLEMGLLRIEQSPEAVAEVIDEMFRAAHTLKGSAGLVKLTTISQIGHRLEDCMEAIRDGKVTVSRQRIDFMLFALDRIRELTRLAMAGEAEPQGVIPQVDSLLAAIEQAPKTEADDEAQGKTPARRPSVEERRAVQPDFAGLERRTETPEEPGGVTPPGVIRLGTDKLENMMNLLGEITVAKTHLVNQLTVMQRMKEEIEFAGHRLLREVGSFADRYAYAMPERIVAGDSLVHDFEELEFDRYDELNLFSRKLQEITSDIGEGLRGLSGFLGGFTSEVEGLDRMVVTMKERLSDARTVRVENLFQRFTRTIRELSRESGKPLQLLVFGGDTAIDRVVFDGLYDPLLHIVRNAVAHGFEPAEERLRRGKPEVGSIWMSARRKGNTIEIEIKDDGRGIQLDKVRRRAVEKGFITADGTMDDSELMLMIFRPGFSTAETADATSGRGVGMNVVMDRLSALNGTINILSDPGHGTSIRLTLPLSLIIINVIQFRCGNQPFVIPTNLVEEIVHLPLAEEPPTELNHRERTIPVIPLRNVFRLPPTTTGESGQPQQRFAIVVQASGQNLALLVDAIISQEDTVIKPFGPFLQGMPHLAGSSIAGDGSLRLVVNPARLLDRETLIDIDTAAAPAEAPAMAGPLRILVVDDSLSVRKFASMVLRAHNFEVVTATQGLEALAELEKIPIDLILTDLEMPVMHGYELLGELGRRNLLESIPTLVLSSRAGQAHRDKALALGARDYLVKPFEEESLVAVVRRHLAGATVY
jgi:chemosensory pili system protein ChpA (sensor histidine kinase/response regulator)